MIKMRSKNKLLFGFLFLVLVGFLIFGGIGLFNYVYSKYIDHGFRDLIESEPGVKIEERNSPVSFDTTVKYAYYFVFSLFSLIVLWYAYEFIDYLVYKFENRKRLN